MVPVAEPVLSRTPVGSRTDEPPLKRPQYKKLTASGIDEAARKVLAQANEIFRVNFLIHGPYQPPMNSTRLAIDSWTEACEVLERPLPATEEILRILDHVVKEWSTGVHKPSDFSQASASAKYGYHISCLAKFETVNADGLAKLRERLYVQGCYRAGVSAEKEEEAIMPLMSDEDFLR
ncbi:hypothetical protein CALCODRAFT_486593 [Calocera cornea HHB12733]|uniref:DUF6532 domain-containing protein n=1 Tax=Calocera cornea HHB12733 TaxID=1353952 RepID=A0A165DMU2_9BASI|nr:hypothetical protein CALCODRAFT_486593 [Calocera cornea HHB12733]